MLAPLHYNMSYWCFVVCYPLPLLKKGGFYKSAVSWCVEAARHLKGKAALQQVLKRNCLNQTTRTHKKSSHASADMQGWKAKMWMECGKQEPGGEGGQIRECFTLWALHPSTQSAKALKRERDVRASFSSINVCSAQKSVQRCVLCVCLCVFIRGCRISSVCQAKQAVQLSTQN